MGATEAYELASRAKDLYVIKGKKIQHIDLSKEHPGKEALVNLMLGPTGNLRAPTILKGKTLIVGFNADTYESLLKN